VPAAAVIPALIAYTKVVAVEKLVVEERERDKNREIKRRVYFASFSSLPFLKLKRIVRIEFQKKFNFDMLEEIYFFSFLFSFTVKKLECLKQALRKVSLLSFLAFIYFSMG